MTDKLSGRFAHLTAQLKTSTAAVSAPPQEERALDRLRRRQASEQDNATTEARPSIEESKIFQIMTDATLDPKEKAEQISEILAFNLDDPEASIAAVKENKEMVLYLARQFTDLNKESMALTRDNPLSELRSSISEVFNEYHQLVSNRSDLKEKLTLIDKIIDKHGGAEGLIKALLSAKDKQVEKEALDASLLEEQKRVAALEGEMKNMSRNAHALQATIADAEKDTFLMFKGEKKRQIAQDKRNLAQIEADQSIKRSEMKQASGSLSSKATALETFVTAEDYQVHEQILEVLDIGNEDFKGKLRDLAELTLSYIDNTSENLEGVRLQLEKLLDRATGVHTVAQNTTENVSIMLQAQEMAQKKNALKLQEAESEETQDGLSAMKKERKVRALNQHISGVEVSLQSTASLSGRIGVIHVDLTNYKDQMQEGLGDAIEQEMLAVGSAAATGNATLMRIETLATFVQGLVAKGQYMQEAEYHLGEIAKEMERSIMSRMAKNEGIRSVGDTIKEITSAMEDRNDAVLQIAEERKTLIDRLISQTQALGRTNEDALGIEATINKRLYGKDLETEGQPTGAGAPSAPALG